MIFTLHLPEEQIEKLASSGEGAIISACCESARVVGSSPWAAAQCLEVILRQAGVDVHVIPNELELLRKRR